MVVMTYPLIGNCGVRPGFLESARPWARALITRQLNRGGLRSWLDEYDIPILTGCGTRRVPFKKSNDLAVAAGGNLA